MVKINTVNKKKVYIFLAISIVIILVVLIKFSYVEKFLDWYSSRIYKNEISKDDLGDANKQNNLDDFDKYPEYIYETFLDKDGNEVVLKMERKVGSVDGEEIIFYEDTAEPDVIYCHFYKGTVKSVDDEKVVFLVDRECKNADPDTSYYDYSDIEDYEIKFNFDDYNLEGSEEFGTCDSIAINTDEINSYGDLEKLVGKYVRVQDAKFRDSATKIIHKGLDFYVK